MFAPSSVTVGGNIAQAVRSTCCGSPGRAQDRTLKMQGQKSLNLVYYYISHWLIIHRPTSQPTVYYTHMPSAVIFSWLRIGLHYYYSLHKMIIIEYKNMIKVEFVIWSRLYFFQAEWSWLMLPSLLGSIHFKLKLELIYRVSRVAFLDSRDSQACCEYSLYFGTCRPNIITGCAVAAALL